MSLSISQHIERANHTNMLKVPILSPTKVATGTTEFNFRILPYKYNENKEPIIEVVIHSGIGADKKNFALCSNMETPDSCPYCAAAKKFRTELSKEEWGKISKDFYGNRSVYIPGVKRGKTLEFYFLKISGYQNFDKELISILTDRQLKELFNLPEDIPYINLWDIKNGIDLIVKVNSKNEKQKNPSFTIDKALKQTPVAKTKEDIEFIGECIKNMPNLIEEMKKAYGDYTKVTELFNAQFKKNQTTSNSEKLKTESHVPENANYNSKIEEEIQIDDIDVNKINITTDEAGAGTSMDDSFVEIMKELE
jgi:glutaredoxin